LILDDAQCSLAASFSLAADESLENVEQPTAHHYMSFLVVILSSAGAHLGRSTNVGRGLAMGRFAAQYVQCR
jgi:hypothetical protein